MGGFSDIDLTMPMLKSDSWQRRLCFLVCKFPSFFVLRLIPVIFHTEELWSAHARLFLLLNQHLNKDAQCLV
jgi:hypothetical protein